MGFARWHFTTHSAIDLDAGEYTFYFGDLLSVLDINLPFEIRIYKVFLLHVLPLQIHFCISDRDPYLLMILCQFLN